MVREVADELYIKRVLMVLEDFLFFLSLLVLLYSKQQYDFERYLDSCSLDTHFELSSATSISPAPDPARYIRGACCTQCMQYLVYAVLGV